MYVAWGGSSTKEDARRHKCVEKETGAKKMMMMQENTQMGRASDGVIKRMEES